MPGETILILGGTGEARRLAGRLADHGGYRVITSLAGCTRTPATPPGETRIGGFGGVAGLRDYIAAEAVDLVVDATHPFAAIMAANAAAACEAAHIPCLRLARPAWAPGPGDDWRHASSVAEAAGALPAGAVALVTTGRQELAPFLQRDDVRIVARMIEPPDSPLPDHVTLILARPPFSLDDERRLLTEHGIDILVAKNAGGDGVSAKLAAARERGMPVVMIPRPDKPPVPTAGDVDGMMALIVGRAG